MSRPPSTLSDRRNLLPALRRVPTATSPWLAPLLAALRRRLYLDASPRRNRAELSAHKAPALDPRKAVPVRRTGVRVGRVRGNGAGTALSVNVSLENSRVGRESCRGSAGEGMGSCRGRAAGNVTHIEAKHSTRTRQARWDDPKYLSKRARASLVASIYTLAWH
jgi:hypothetical protein